jgi:hypothetical protein
MSIAWFLPLFSGPCWSLIGEQRHHLASEPAHDLTPAFATA